MTIKTLKLTDGVILFYKFLTWRKNKKALDFGLFFFLIMQCPTNLKLTRHLMMKFKSIKQKRRSNFIHKVQYK